MKEPEREDLIRRLKDETRVLDLPSVRHAFEVIDRADFVEDDYLVEAYEDYALPSQKGQTISQPTTVAFMLEKLGAEKGEKVLNVGSGSGWTTALLADMVGPEGRVWGVEIIPELIEAAEKNLQKYNLPQAEIVDAADKLGFKQNFLYDRILVNASAEELPQALLSQLKIGGVLVIPINDSLVRAEKISETDTDTEEFPGFAFVPLIHS